MSAITVGSLCSGYEGIGLGLAEAGIEHELAFVADPDPAASAVLAHHYPGVRNLGDISLVDWSTVERVCLLTMGFPCTDVSLAGRGAGIAAGTRSGLWLECARAIDALRPSLVLIENVRGLLSARAHSDVEPCPWCLGDRGGNDQEPVLRALGAVLGDLSDLGYDAEWVTIAAGREKSRATDHVGACHERERVFIIARPADTAVSLLPTPRASDTNGAGRHGDGGVDLRTAVSLLPTPRASASENRQTQRTPSQEAGTHGLSLAAEVCTLFPTAELLPTPTASRYGSNQSASRGAAVRPGLDSIGALLPTPTAQNAHGNHRNNRGDLLLPGVVQMLPTPRATDGTHGGPNQRGSSGDLMLPAAVQPSRWGKYAAAVARWEAILGRPAPEPTEPGRDGKPRLAARFTEWVMGLPDGWVCDVPGLSRNDMLRLLGNGVVRQQLAYALRLLAGAR